MEPANGATVKSPVHLVFGSEKFTIAPVPPGEVTEAQCAEHGHSTSALTPTACRRGR